MLNWARDGADWPNRQFSQFIEADQLRFHVQIMGQGPALLLLHGTAAASHSFRDLGPILARDFTVIIPDLPGHGFTTAPRAPQMALDPIAAAVMALLRQLNIAPRYLAGHSAGAAIAARIALDQSDAPRGVISLNGALLPMPGLTGAFYGSMAKMMALMPTMPWFFAFQAHDQAAVQSLIAQTGSRLDPAGLVFYRRLFKNPVLVSNMLCMMANWTLDRLVPALPALGDRLVLITGENDHAVPPAVSHKVARLVPGARVMIQSYLGHLAHEEDPAGTAELIKWAILRP